MAHADYHTDIGVNLSELYTYRITMETSTEDGNRTLNENSTECSSHILHADHKDPSTCSAFKTLIDIYLVSILCVVGIVGNVLSIVVLGRDKTMRRTTAFLLQMVAVADALYLSTCLLIQTANTITLCTDWFAGLQSIWPHMEPFIWPLASMAQTCTVWLVVVLTADRYVAICKPLHSNHWMTTPRMRKVVLLVFILAIAYNIPRFFERIVERTILCDNQVHYETNRTWLRNNRVYILTYKTSLYFILRYFIPLSLLAFFNTNLIQAIRRSSELQRKGSRSTTKSYSQRNQHTRILVVIVLVFVLCGLPDCILRVWISICAFMDRPVTWYPLPIRDFNTFSNLCLTVNSCINFVIYCLLGGKFRHILICMCCKRTTHHCHSLNQQMLLQNLALKSHNQPLHTSSELMTHVAEITTLPGDIYQWPDQSINHEVKTGLETARDVIETE